MWTGIVLRPVSSEVYKTHHLSLELMEKPSRRHRHMTGDFRITLLSAVVGVVTG